MDNGEWDGTDPVCTGEILKSSLIIMIINFDVCILPSCALLKILCDTFKACPKNAYRGGPANCFPCPMNSHTEGNGSSMDQCICDDGFIGPGGGPCNGSCLGFEYDDMHCVLSKENADDFTYALISADIDECESGLDQCEQDCYNAVGGYHCDCSKPGQVIDHDGVSCRGKYNSQVCLKNSDYSNMAASFNILELSIAARADFHPAIA